MIEIKIVAAIILWALFTALWGAYFIDISISRDWCETKSILVMLLPLWLPLVLVLLFL